MGDTPPDLPPRVGPPSAGWPSDGPPPAGSPSAGPPPARWPSEGPSPAGPPPAGPPPSAYTRLQDPPAARLARAAEELCATLWEALHDELRHPRARRVAELSERLAQICSAVADLAAEAPVPEPPAPELEPPVRPGQPMPRESSVPPEAREIAVHDIRREGLGPSVMASEEDPPASVVPAGIGRAGWRRRGEEDPTAWAERDGESSAALWVESIEASLERYAVDRLPFAVLLVEVRDVERLAQAESPAALLRLLDAIEQAVAPELRCTDSVVRESRGRWWLTASRTDAGGACVLAERLGRAARAVADHRGVPLDLAIGIAVCPADGRDSATLAAHADVGLYAARAVGRTVAPVDDDAA